MRHLDLLGTGLKSDFLCDLFETYDVQVVYEYDRTHEGLADEYHAELPDLGLQFVFDAKQVLRTLFLRPVEVSTLNPFNPDDDRIQRFNTKADAIRYAHENGLQFSEGLAELMGEQKDWIRFKSDTHSIHFEFVDSELRLITLQAVSAT
ncbi:MAG: hypothetical protein Fues2KO_08650 [Fuerstiella sp.]